MHSTCGHTAVGGEQLSWISINTSAHRWRAAEAEEASKPCRKTLPSGGEVGGKAESEEGCV